MMDLSNRGELAYIYIYEIDIRHKNTFVQLNFFINRLKGGGMYIDQYNRICTCKNSGTKGLLVLWDLNYTSSC